MLIKMSNFPDGEEVIAEVTEEQLEMLDWLKERKALTPDFVFEEVEVVDLR